MKKTESLKENERCRKQKVRPHTFTDCYILGFVQALVEG
jgi:hypothetical protein